MPRLVFTSHLQRFLSAPPAEVPAGSVREALEAVFADNPKLRGYILEEIRETVGSAEDLRAEMDVIAVLSNCPEALNPATGAKGPTPIRAIVYVPD